VPKPRGNRPSSDTLDIVSPRWSAEAGGELGPLVAEVDLALEEYGPRLRPDGRA
jgi:hypothetical protein